MKNNPPIRAPNPTRPPVPVDAGVQRNEALIVPEDYKGENTQPIARLAKWLPPGTAGKRLDPSTLHRWRQKGLWSPRLQRKVALPAFRMGGTWYSSVEKLQWFIDVTAEFAVDPVDVPAPPTPRQVSARQRYVEEMCRRKGLLFTDEQKRKEEERSAKRVAKLKAAGWRPGQPRL